jgi:hypothetical protein
VASLRADARDGGTDHETIDDLAERSHEES